MDPSWRERSLLEARGGGKGGGGAERWGNRRTTTISITPHTADWVADVSTADATRLIKSGSLWLNDRKVNDPRHELHRQDLVEGRVAMMKVGNRNHLVLNVVEGSQ